MKDGGTKKLIVLKKLRTTNTYIFLIILCFIISVVCIFIRTSRSKLFSVEQISLLSAKPVFPRGYIPNNIFNLSNLKFINNSNSSDYNSTRQTSNSEYSTDNIPHHNKILGPDFEEKHSPNEKTYKVIESQFSSSGLKVDNFYVKNVSGAEINIDRELSSSPDVHIKSTKDIQVLIYHTHTSESYLRKDQGFFYESYYPRSTDSSINVTRVGDAITEKLIEHGISTLHDTTYHDVPTYKGSYARSYKTIKSNLEKYPSIQVTIDIHRDSLGERENGKIKPTFKINGSKAAQIMIITGFDKDGSLGFPDWEQNLRFALRLQQKCETMFPGLTRPMFLGNVRYNLNLSHGSILIEVGSDVNTLDEAVYSGTLLGESLAHLLNELK